MYKPANKREREREISPMGNKRTRGTLGRYEDHSSDGGDNRRGGRSRSPSYRNYDDYRGGGGGGGGSSQNYKEGPPRPYPYKVLCVSSLHSKASDEVIRETLYREFKRYGDISVKIVNEPDERVAYVYFRSYDDAREAKHSKSRIIIYDRPVLIEAAYESSSQSQQAYLPSSTSSSTYHRDSSSTTTYNKERDREPYRRSPMNNYDRHGGGGGRDEPRYDRGGGGGGGGNYPPAPPPYYPKMDYRREPHPPPHHYPPPPPHHSDNSFNMRSGPPQQHFNPRFGGNAPRHHPVAPPPVPPGGSGERTYENKKDKFPNYLHHISPEDDPLATRTLFAGNLEVNITEEELRRIFTRFGQVEDIDIKRPPPGTGNAYAFVRFHNLDMASKAKSELSGQYIGKFQCKIGYGKANPTTRIWIGGLGNWTSMGTLERELDRFGSIKKIEWAKGDIQAFITFETIDAAAAAVKDMRGYPLGGPERRIRTDFAEANLIAGAFPENINNNGNGNNSTNNNKKYNEFEEANTFEGNDKGFRGSDSGSYKRSSNNYRNNNVVLTDTSEKIAVESAGGGGGGGGGGGSRLSTGSGHSSPSELETRGRVDTGGAQYLGIKSIADLSRRIGPTWNGSLILKNSSFPSELFLIEGAMSGGIETSMKDEEGKNQLRITQRLRLEESKLDDVQKRILTATAFGVFLALTPSVSSPASTDGSSVLKSHPLKNLVSYLKSKDAAGVISLSSGGSGVLYVFPPCEFSENLITKSAPDLKIDREKEGFFLVVIVIRGGAS